MNLLDYFYPPACALCGADLDLTVASPTDPSTALLCAECGPIEPALSRANCCLRCGEPMPSVELGRNCILCSVSPLAPVAIVSAFHYDGCIEDLVKIYKYGRRRALGRHLARLFCRAILNERYRPASLGDPLIIPVPSDPAHLRSRGFHHLIPFVRELSRQTSWKAKLFALRSAGPREQQAALSPRARWKNIAGAFTTRAKDVSGRNIVLLDDVITTGATIHSAAESLLAAGATSVTALTFARSRQFVHHRMERVFSEPSPKRSVKGS